MLGLGGIKIKVKGSENTGTDTVTLTDTQRQKHRPIQATQKIKHTDTEYKKTD